MISRLVLVRHAKAQSRDKEIPDEKREITAAGKRSIEARYPINLQLLAELEPDELRIWSSPTMRTLQTAEVIARVLGVEGIETHELLYTDDVEAFLSELADAQGTVIAVGHNPFMEELFERFSGISQDLGKGAIASFEIQQAANEGQAFSAWLEWFVQGPRVALWKSIVGLEHGLASAGKRITDCADARLANPEDPETLHQYRISLRIARSLLAFVQPYCKKGTLKDTLSQLKALQAPTSYLRELDMLSAVLDFETPEANACELLRSQVRSKYMDSFSRRATKKAIRRVSSQLKNIPWREHIRRYGLDAALLDARVQQMREENERDMLDVDFSDIEAVHAVRKKAKALRYVTREFAECLPDDAGEMSSQAKGVQNKLGDLCDCRTNARLVVEICGPESVETAARFVLRANAIVAELESNREHQEASTAL